MSKNPRCLYNSDFRLFIDGDIDAILDSKILCHKMVKKIKSK